MTFQHAGHQQSGGMLPELAGNIADPDFFVSTVARDGRDFGRESFAAELRGAALQTFRGGRHALPAERIGRQFSRHDVVADFRDQTSNSIPVADIHFLVKQHSLHEGMLRVDRQQPAIGVGGLVMAFELVQRRAAVAPGAGHGGIERDGPVAAGQGFCGPAQIHQRPGPVAMGFRESGLELDRLVVALHCLLGTPERDQGVAAIAPGLGEIRLERDGPVIAFQRLVEPLEVAQPVAQIAMRRRVIRVQGDGPGEQPDALKHAAGLQGQHTQQMQGREIVGLLTENLEAGISRRGKIAEPVCGIGPAKTGLDSFTVGHFKTAGARQAVFQ